MDVNSSLFDCGNGSQLLEQCIAASELMLKSATAPEGDLDPYFLNCQCRLESADTTFQKSAVDLISGVLFTPISISHRLHLSGNCRDTPSRLRVALPA